MVERLVDRRPSLGIEELLARFVPPARFAGVRFSTYRPDDGHPSQAAALAAMTAFASSIGAEVTPSGGWFARRRVRSASGAGDRPARYLDGGFGVGKTHLLAATWHAVAARQVPAAYLSFGELTASVGFLGMARAVDAFSSYRLVCIDEFELDDVANTLMLVTFLRGAIGAGVRVAATSNTLPDRLGEGRFSAEDFSREISAIGAHFDLVRLDGPDYRHRGDPGPQPAGDDARLAALAAGPGSISLDDLDPLLAHLRRVHPVQLGALIDGLDGVCLRGLHPIADQADALLLVQLIDALYDAGLVVAVSGCPIGELFDASYRSGGYRKKYGRAESRLAALVAESSAS